jgi:N-acetylglucosaminyldiphosphoundecaprenol N-acetyl-beta-D-mannosaminyltransferase
MLGKKNILGIGITDASQKDILEYVVKNIENFKKKTVVVTPNPEFLVFANKNVTFKSILNKADLALADGIGVMVAAKILGKPLKSRFTGVDFVKSLCNRIAEKPITVGFLGGRSGVAEKTAECLRKMHPKLKVAFAGEGWSGDMAARQPRLSDDAHLLSFEKQSFNSASLNKSRLQSETKPTFNSSENGLPRNNNLTTKQFNNKIIDILFVAFGAPKQEFWINENLEKLPVKVAVGVGGAFDYISGKIPRAPKFVRSIGLEWLFRLVVQPWRIKRQLSLLKFIYLVIKERIRM